MLVWRFIKNCIVLKYRRLQIAIRGIKKSLELQKFKGFFITESLVVPPGIEHLKFFVFKVLINSTKSYIVKIKTIELAIFLISIISIFIAVIFLTVQRYGKGSIYPNTIGIFFGGNFIMYSFIMIRTKLYPVFFSLVLTFKTKSLSPNEKLKYSLLGISAICKIEYMRIFSSSIYTI